MKLSTKVPLQSHPSSFGYDDQLLLLGSCFAENIGKQLAYHKFQATTNPFGILFHPLAIERILQETQKESPNFEDSIFEHQGIWKSYVAHSSLNSSSRGALIDKLQTANETLKSNLLSASKVFITLGTAWVYQHKASGIPVANCHKVAQKEFAKGLLPIEVISDSLERQCALIKGLNPKAEVVFTVSPIRHLKDGFTENTRSKAHLIAAVHQCVEKGLASYFPAYEIVMDELRDYRFYNADMLHPSKQTITYIWEQFLEVYAFAKAQKIVKEVAAIQSGLAHKPFSENSEEHQAFLTRLHHRVDILKGQYPHMEF